MYALVGEFNLCMDTTWSYDVIEEIRKSYKHSDYLIEKPCCALGSSCLQVKKASAKEMTSNPARIAVADAVKHMSWIADNYQRIESQLIGVTWQTTLVSIPPLHLQRFAERSAFWDFYLDTSFESPLVWASTISSITCCTPFCKHKLECWLLVLSDLVLYVWQVIIVTPMIANHRFSPTNRIKTCSDSITSVGQNAARIMLKSILSCCRLWIPS